MNSRGPPGRPINDTLDPRARHGDRFEAASTRQSLLFSTFPGYQTLFLLFPIIPPWDEHFGLFCTPVER